MALGHAPSSRAGRGTGSLEILLTIARLTAQPVHLLWVLGSDRHLRAALDVARGDGGVLENDGASPQQAAAFAGAGVLHVGALVLLRVDQRLHPSPDVADRHRVFPRHRDLDAAGDVLDVGPGARHRVGAVGHLAAR